ncbi:MAG: class I SAM-dependent methyltransferase [Gammaproteobacteria bacterium]|nr:class I SAM-dependent methyltransferase [Gammaproteobacteria bacterium]
MAGFYERVIGAPLINCLCGSGFITRYRAEIVPYATGHVLELGIGSGLNLPLYDPAKVTRVTGVDPSARMRELGAARLAAAAFPVDCIGLSGEDIDLPMASIDTVVVTFSLCTIPNALRALQAAKRLLKPGGELLFLEHGRAPDPIVATWQDRLNGVWNRLACGCNLNRNMPLLIEEAGFEIQTLGQEYARGLPRLAAYLSFGRAH